MQVACLGDEVFVPDGHCQYIPRGPYVPKGNIVEGSESLLIEGMPVALLGHKAIAGGETTLTSGSEVFFVDGRQVHRLGDDNHCGGYTTKVEQSTMYSA